MHTPFPANAHRNTRFQTCGDNPRPDPPREGRYIYDPDARDIMARATSPRWLALLQGIIALALGVLLLTYPVGILVVLIFILGTY